MPKKTATQLQREIDQALTKRSSWHDEPSSPKKLFRYTKNELEAMPTLSSGHTANLKIEGEVGGIPTRWWLSRMTVYARYRHGRSGRFPGAPRLETTVA